MIGRRTFLLALVGGLTAGGGLVAATSAPATAGTLSPTPARSPGNAAAVRPRDPGGLRIKEARDITRPRSPWRRPHRNRRPPPITCIRAPCRLPRRRRRYWPRGPWW